MVAKPWNTMKDDERTMNNLHKESNKRFQQVPNFSSMPFYYTYIFITAFKRLQKEVPTFRVDTYSIERSTIKL